MAAYYFILFTYISYSVLLKCSRNGILILFIHIIFSLKYIVKWHPNMLYLVNNLYQGYQYYYHDTYKSQVNKNNKSI